MDHMPLDLISLWFGWFRAWLMTNGEICWTSGLPQRTRYLELRSTSSLCINNVSSFHVTDHVADSRWILLVLHSLLFILFQSIYWGHVGCCLQCCRYLASCREVQSKELALPLQFTLTASSYVKNVFFLWDHLWSNLKMLITIYNY